MKTSLAAAALLITTQAAHAAPHSQKDQQIGDANHPKILRQFGGAIDNPALTDYVTQIGRKLVAVSERADAKWTFTVLDSPVVNAFALPGGYIYVTRGLLALANDEAELAGVLGHEIGHVTANHPSKRQERTSKGAIGVIGGAVLGGIFGGKDGLKKGLEIGSKAAAGYTAQYSQKQEFEADTLGVRYLLKAGYDPTAQADFLDSMGDAAGLEAKLRGKEYDPNQVNFFASHPATAERVRKAIRNAKSAARGKAPTTRNQERFMRRIDGMIYGDSPAQGFVRGRRFDHPKLRFGFEVPPGFTILNASSHVSAIGPDNARMIMDGASDPGGRLSDYLRGTWIPQLSRKNKISRVQKIENLTVNGLSAARTQLSTTIGNRNTTVQLMVLRHNNRLYRLQGLAAASNRTQIRALAQAMRRFEPLSAAQVQRLKPYRLHSYQVRRGDTLNMLAATLPFDTLRRERLTVLNGLDDRQLEAGGRVKLVFD